MTFCACGSKQEYLICCGRFIEQNILPETTEQLMRSRYTAYTQANIDYIQQTQQGLAEKDFDAESVRRWAKRAKWLDLTILDVATVDFVEFVARYCYAGKIEQIHDRSKFEKIDGRWYFVASHQSNS
jgi:SEC-C motif-containing protein